MSPENEIELRTSRRTDPTAAARKYFREGKSLKASFEEAGYSPAQARKGKALLTERKSLAKAFLRERQRQVRRFAALGNGLTPEEQEALVRGVLVDSALRGEDGSGRGRNRAAELLGRDRRVNMFTADLAVGIVALPVPLEWKDAFTPSEDADGSDLDERLVEVQMSDGTSALTLAPDAV